MFRQYENKMHFLTVWSFFSHLSGEGRGEGVWTMTFLELQPLESQHFENNIFYFIFKIVVYPCGTRQLLQ